MFLKRIEMQGFKSFVDRTVIDFENPVTGIVGPNGCGKSNISDAIRWVLGEQSVRSLRGEKMTDVIFSGSEGRRAVNMAEVTLVFNNENHYLNSDLDELQVTRRIYNTDQDAEYLINGKNVRLKDVVDLFLDSGLGRDSLSMISQGNISSFAEAKPYDRRSVFEEAAGVAKYKKRKVESLSKLERTKENLDRTFDILSELERQVLPLKRQAHKAEIYREKKKRLEEIEVAVLVEDIRALHEEQLEIDKSIFDLDTQIAMYQTTIQVHENNAFENKSLLKDYDKEINSIQEKIVLVLNSIQQLETRRIEIDEKRKYAIQTGNTEEKLKEMKTLLNEAKLEYDDRVDRLGKLNAELELLNNNLEETAISLADASLKKEELINTVNRTENRIEVLKNLIKDPFSSQAQSGVKTIMDNKSSFYGIYGVVGQELHPLSGYEDAIATALAGSVYHIVTKDESCARKAIEFLKRNRSGRATFLPLTVLKGRNIRYEDEIICSKANGYLGSAADYIECSKEYEIVRDSLLGNVIVCDNLENANDLSSMLKYGYKIVTLEGDVVHKGGSMTGGRVKNETSLVSAAGELNRLSENIVSQKASMELALREYNSLVNRKDNINSQITEKRISLAALEPVVEAKKAKYEKLRSEYENVSPDQIDESEKLSNTLLTDLNNAYSTRDDLSSLLKIKRDERMKLSADIDRKDQQIRQVRRQLDEANTSARNISGQKAAVDTKLENVISRLASEYSMTYEYAVENSSVVIDETAKEEVLSLRKEIASLGNINMSAPEEYEELNERYEFLKKNYDDLVSSRDKILAAISEMDEIMKSQFKETFDLINAELNNTFRVFFNGGRAKLVLEDENDILNTGIDIDVQPPGKSVKSIRLFSGGEKSLIAICVLFTILKVRPVPLIVFDEVEAALDQANVERFAKYVKSFEKDSQFLIITHRPGTMAQCDVLYGVTMQNRGVSQMLKVKLVEAIGMAETESLEGVN